jgi:hypothetical protein
MHHHHAFGILIDIVEHAFASLRRGRRWRRTGDTVGPLNNGGTARRRRIEKKRDVLAAGFVDPSFGATVSHEV